MAFALVNGWPSVSRMVAWRTASRSAAGSADLANPSSFCRLARRSGSPPSAITASAPARLAGESTVMPFAPLARWPTKRAASAACAASTSAGVAAHPRDVSDSTAAAAEARNVRRSMLRVMVHVLAWVPGGLASLLDHRIFGHHDRDARLVARLDLEIARDRGGNRRDVAERLGAGLEAARLRRRLEPLDRLVAQDRHQPPLAGRRVDDE